VVKSSPLVGNDSPAPHSPADLPSWTAHLPAHLPLELVPPLRLGFAQR
jgi:hypothetical protein